MKGIFLDMYQKTPLKERKAFIQFVDSPFFNQNPNLQRLIRALEKQLKASKKIDKHLAYQECFGDEPFNGAKYDNLISDLLHLWYNYLTQIGLNRSPATQKQLLVRYLLDQEWFEPCSAQLGKFAKIIQATPWQDQQYWQAESQYQYLEDQQKVIQNRREYSPHLQLRNDALDRYYHLEKMRIACDMASRSNAVNATYNNLFMEEIIQWYHHHPSSFREFPAFQLYSAAYRLFSAPESSTTYQDLKTQLELHLELIPIDELRHLYTYLINYAVQQSNSGDNQFYQELFELYRFLLEKSILIKNDSLTQWTFTNIITVGIRTKNYAWTEQFIQENNHFLLPELRQNVVTYNLANLHFEKKDYASALRMLHNVEFTDSFYHLSAKFIQLKIYYVLHETEALLALIQTTRRFLQRNRQLSTYQKKSSLHFLTLLQKLTQATILQSLYQVPKAHYHKLKKDYLQMSPLANKQWLEEMIEELNP